MQGMSGNSGTKYAIDNWFIRRTASALCSWLLTSATTPIGTCMFFLCKACPGTSRTRDALHFWMRTRCRLVYRRICMLGMPPHIPLQARKKEFLCIPVEGHKILCIPVDPRLTRGFFTIHYRGEKHSSFPDIRGMKRVCRDKTASVY